jgi:hypothetical protein
VGVGFKRQRESYKLGRANRQKERTDARINVNELSTYAASDAPCIGPLKV